MEILVSTIHRNSLDFLYKMFQNNDISDYHILVVNQTTEIKNLQSDLPNIRIINSHDIGLSKSRNLAIASAVGNICLLADDDVVFLKGFEKTILESYLKIPNADVITFQTLTTENKPFSKYPERTIKLNGFSKYVLSIEMTFQRKSIVGDDVRFDEQFGLGATFQDSENFLFLRELNKSTKMELYFVPEYIVMHEPLSSSDDIASNRFIFARSALNYKLYGHLAYAYIVKLIFFLLRKKLIGFKEIIPKFKVAHSGIETYKKLNPSD